MRAAAHRLSLARREPELHRLPTAQNPATPQSRCNYLLYGLKVSYDVSVLARQPPAARDVRLVERIARLRFRRYTRPARKLAGTCSHAPVYSKTAEARQRWSASVHCSRATPPSSLETTRPTRMCSGSIDQGNCSRFASDENGRRPPPTSSATRPRSTCCSRRLPRCVETANDSGKRDLDGVRVVLSKLALELES